MSAPIKMPDLATVDGAVKVLRWLVSEGDRVERGDPLMEVETDKATVVVESVASGRLCERRVNDGQMVATGEIIALIDAQSTAEGDEDRAGAIREARTANRYDATFLRSLYERMVQIREFEEGVRFLFLEGAMPGTIHQCQGQEATAVGVCAALGPGDWITSTFRGHGHALAKGLRVDELLFELYGATTGCCRGKGGSMHVGSMARGMVPGIAIVAGGIPLAAGMALAIKMRREPHVVACFFGDGAVAEGAFHEGVNLAAIWNLPVIFVCENNLYGASTRVDHVMRAKSIAERAASYGIRGETVDGNEVLAVYQATQRAAAECRTGHGPVLLELLTYRRTGHSRRDTCAYQPKEEREHWSARDPIERFATSLIEQCVFTKEDVDAITQAARRDFTRVVAEAGRQPMPTISDLTTDMLAPPESSVETTEVPLDAPTRRLSIAEALREAIAEEMRRDPRVFCMGEDIATPGGWGGAFTVTLGLEKEFPDRMLNTPIAELGFFGTGVGAAMLGMRPIVDVQYGDFLFLAMDQIVNNAAKLRYMSGGEIAVPLVMRAPVGATGRAAQHAQSLERFFIGVPGMKVAAVSNAYDAKGILKAAVRDGNPVMIFEHKLLYGSKGARAESGAVDATSDVPEADYIVPLGTAARRRPGRDVTILGWLLMLHYALHAADELAAEGISAEVIDVRSLLPIDYDTIGASVCATGRVVIVEEGPKTGGVGAELAAGIAERFGKSLRSPVVRVASADVPVPFSPVLEDLYRPDKARIVEAVRNLMCGDE